MATTSEVILAETMVCEEKGALQDPLLLCDAVCKVPPQQATIRASFGFKGVGVEKNPNIFLLLFLYKASLHNWKREAPGGDEGQSMAQLFPTPPSRHKQAGMRLD